MLLPRIPAPRCSRTISLRTVGLKSPIFLRGADQRGESPALFPRDCRWSGELRAPAPRSLETLLHIAHPDQRRTAHEEAQGDLTRWTLSSSRLSAWLATSLRLAGGAIARRGRRPTAPAPPSRARRAATFGPRRERLRGCSERHLGLVDDATAACKRFAAAPSPRPAGRSRFNRLQATRTLSESTSISFAACSACSSLASRSRKNAAKCAA